MKVLLVDDSRATRAMLRNMLKTLCASIVEADNGRTAYEALQTQGPMDLALVDWNMPVQNGYDFLQQVRREPRYDSMQIMMVTTETELSQMVKAVEAGANEYLMKPFTCDMLVEKLRLLGLNLEE